MSSVDTSNAPYYDDFDPDKGFLRILFRPKSVQARELTQAQTILQEQVNRLGRHLFKDGSMVIPGGVRVSNSQDYVKIGFISGSVIEDILDRGEMTVSSNVTGLAAKVQKIIPAEGEDPVTLFVDYVNSGSDNMTKKFSDGESLKFTIVVDEQNQNIANARCDGVGLGTWAQVDRGVYFIRGYMVQNSAQDVVVSKYTQDPEVRIGFRVTETIVTEDEDDSLFSNAQGTPNFKAPGAHRFKIDLNLEIVDSASVEDEDFVELARVAEGVTQSQVTDTDYAYILKTIAQRTYEESGDYTLGDYKFSLKEHIRDAAHPQGVYEAGDGGDESKFVFALKPGISYVKGYRVQNIATENIAVEKARDFASVNNTVGSAVYQNYITVTGVHSLPPSDIRKKINLHDANIVAGASAGSIIGTARVRAIQREGNDLKLFLFDIKMNTGKNFSQVKGVRYTDASSLFGATVADSSVYGSNQNLMIFRLPYEAVKTLKGSGSSDTTYAVTRQYSVTTNASGVASISLGSNETFASPNQQEFFASVTGAANTGELVPWAAGLFTLGGAPVGRSMTVNAGVSFASKTMIVNVVVYKSQPLEKTKTKIVKVDNVTFTNQSVKNLTKCDGYKLNSVIEDLTGNVVTSAFSFRNGQTDNGYGLCSLVSRSGNISGTYVVTYEYFEHSTGDYFSVDSYSGVPYEDIPTYTSSSKEAYELSDCLDFRPLYDAAGDITSSTFTGDIIRPSDTVRADVDYYLPRRDSVYVSAAGTFGVAKGVPGVGSKAPEVPSDAMKLFELEIPAYTFEPKDVRVTPVDNRRYTMRDIGKLEKRIENLEYYTTLSAVESGVNKTQIIDPVTGTDRYKNGFATDGFIDFRLSDVDDEEYMFAIDPEGGVGQPSFDEFPADMYFSSGTNHAVGEALVSKSYTLKKSVSQPYATRSINVNPFAVFTWNGFLKLNPETDFWKDVWYVEPILVNETIDNRGSARPGTVVSSWQSGNRFFTNVRTTTFGEVNTVNVDDNFLRNVIINFMREIEINFTATAMRPYTRVYPFFEGRAVSQWCRPLGGTNGQALVTDVNGSLRGVFTVPNTVADRFETGVNTFRLTDSPTDSRGAVDFTTSAQTNHTSGGSADIRQQTITSTRTLIATTTSTTTSVVRDPIAQTFWVDTPGGEFIAAVDIFMRTKSSSVPLVVELRTVDNGYPSGDVLPFGRRILNPSEVSISESALVPTRVTFDDLVYLEQGREYALVFLADTQEYNAWICQMGELVIGSTRSVSAQPSLGSFFKSQNGSTWSADQNQDMKFTFYRASFSTEDTVVTFKSKAPLKRPAIGFNPISTTSGNSRIVIKQRSHGLKAGDPCVISGALGGNGFSTASLNKSHTVESVSGDNITINIGTLATATGAIGGETVQLKTAYPFSLVFPNSNQLEVDGTTIEWSLVAKTQSNRGMAPARNIAPATTLTMLNESVVLVDGDFQLVAKLKSSKDNISPIIDVDGMTAILVQPRINTEVNNPLCRYVTRDVKFDTPSTSARFYVGALLPGSSNMKFYYKLINGGESSATGSWVELAPKTGIVNDDKRFREYTYELEDVGTFSGYKVKIVLLGSDPTNVPKLSDFRSIALA